MKVLSSLAIASLILGVESFHSTLSTNVFFIHSSSLRELPSNGNKFRRDTPLHDGIQTRRLRTSNNIFNNRKTPIAKMSDATFDSTSNKTNNNLKSKLPVVVIQTVNIQESSKSNDMIDVASFRNNCTSPIQLIENQEKKKEDISSDPKKSIVDGLLAGLFAGFVIVGTGIGSSKNNVDDFFTIANLKSFATVSILVGAMIAANNLAGNRVFVYTEAEAINRLMVDFVPMLKSGDDIGFIAKINVSKDNDLYAEKYNGTNGIVGAVDCQLRNSEMGFDSNREERPSYAANKKFGNLPCHFHIKNMLVDDGMRRQGVAKKLIAFLENFARKNTDAKFLTLEVDESNTGALSLYESVGFTTGQITESSKEYGNNLFGRKFMTKAL